MTVETVKPITNETTFSTQEHKPLPSTELATKELNRFLLNPALDEFARNCGFSMGSDEDYLSELQRFAAQNWDSRKGKERYEVSWQDAAEPELQEAVFYTQKLGMIDASIAQRPMYDYLLVPGGAEMSPYYRLRYGLEQNTKYKNILLLSGHRKVAPIERAKADTYAPNAQTEFDLMNGAAQKLLGDQIVTGQTFELNEPSRRAHNDPRGWRLIHHATHNGTNILSLATTFEPSNDKGTDARLHKHRPNTSDTYAFMRQVLGSELNPGSKLLLATNAYYVPAQHLDAVRELTLSAGVEVETIGYDADYAGKSLSPTFLKQELKSAIDAAARLRQAITDANK